MQTDEKLYWVWLSNVPGIGARRFYKLISALGSPKNVFDAPDSELKALPRLIGERCTHQLASSRNQKALGFAERILNTPDIKVLTLMCPEYPSLLKTIYDPPAVLYTKGCPLKYEAKAIAIVGSRRSSEYGRMTAFRIASELAAAGITVVSGMARGIDTYVHKGALKAQSGYTVAVLGCGVDYIYPPENKALYNEIQEKGTIISEYPPGTKPAPGNFPARNRIISGLSSGTLVIEAGQKSGALITVDYALDQGREVYALPGNVSSPFSRGTNELLKQGAKVITSADDILEDLDIEIRLSPHQPSNAAVLDFFETQVYNALLDGEKGIEELIQLTKLDSGRLNSVLTLMEIKGIIKQIPGKIFMLQWKA
ncbi:MAG TPA: DNA-processing protein DprA [Candidatus Atribacteria bacterium]|nr:DNA-processing protein DprA [Candidatus Atribacteria bacterium]HPT77855.1 DNA-processing protein DprA [Candidatus Atribacteria bacterium]